MTVIQATSVFKAAPLPSAVTPEEFGAIGNGTTDDTVAVQAAITNAIATKRDVMLTGNYLLTAGLTSFHAVNWRGQGMLTRSGVTFRATNNQGFTNRIYVASTGNDANDGLTSALPFLTLQAAFNALIKFGPVLYGLWRIEVAAGTYAGATWPSRLQSSDRVTIRGPEASRATPTVIISGALGGAVGLQFNDGANIYIKDVMFTGFTAVGRYGLLGEGPCNLYLDNVHADGNYFNIGARAGAIVRFRYGRYTNALYANILGIDFALLTIGYLGSTVYSGTGPFLATDGSHISGGALYGVFASENTQGHLDFCRVDGNNVGLFLAYGSRLNSPGTLFNGNTIGVNQINGSAFIGTATTTFTGNTTNVLNGPFSGRVDSGFASVPNIGAVAYLGGSLASTVAPATIGSYQKHIDAFAKLPANCFIKPGAKLRVKVAGTINKSAAASGRMIALRLYAGGGILAAASINTNSAATGSFSLEIDVFAVDANTQKHTFEIDAGASRLSYVTETFIGTTALNMTVANDLHFYTFRDSASDTFTIESCVAEMFSVLD